MPRLPPSLIRQARALDPNLARLLPVCRDLDSARNELRWLGEYATRKGEARREHERRLERYVARRARGEPLQYILGTEYFGELEIRCRMGVLIPRPETAASVTYLAGLLVEQSRQNTSTRQLRILDLCTGTGCIPLLLRHELAKSLGGSTGTSLEIVGVDISSTALALAQENLASQEHLERQTTGRDDLPNIAFLQADILPLSSPSPNGVAREPPPLQTALATHHGPEGIPRYNVLISNPPYISSKDYRTTTARSVRHFEPKLALVPPSSSHTSPLANATPQSPPSNDGSDGHDGDLFYPPLLAHAQILGVKTLLLEVGDLQQAVRVAGMVVQQGGWERVELWRDVPDHPDLEVIGVGERRVDVRGRGEGRSVFAWRR